MRRSLSWVLLAAAFALVVGLAVYDDSRTRAQLSFYSTYDTGPNGYRALYETLASSGAPVRRFEREIGLLDPDIHTLVISSSDLEVRSGIPIDRIDSADAKRLARFVERGGRLVVLSEDDPASLAPFKLDGGRSDFTASTFEPVARVPLNADVRAIRATTRHLYRYRYLTASVPLFGTRAGASVVERPFGKGEVVSILMPAVFSNKRLTEADNARFAFALFGDGKPVAFDERVHGYVVDKSFWAALPSTVRAAVWIVVAIGALMLIDANIRFAPAVPLEPADERDSSAYIASMATLLRRGRAARSAIARFADDAQQRLRRRPTEREHVRTVVADLERLRTIERPGDATLVRAARLNALLRKDLA